MGAGLYLRIAMRLRKPFGRRRQSIDLLRIPSGTASSANGLCAIGNDPFARPTHAENLVLIGVRWTMLRS